MTPEAARHAAMREFGAWSKPREEYREQRGLPLVDGLLQDVDLPSACSSSGPASPSSRLARWPLHRRKHRHLYRRHSVLLQQLPFSKAERLVIVWSVYGNEGAHLLRPELMTIRERSRLFEDLGGIWAQSGALTGEATRAGGTRYGDS